MLAVDSRQDWELIFESRSDLKNCNVKIYDKDDNLLLDKVHIGSYSLTSRNCFVCDKAPTDECSIEIIDWAGLSTSTKNYLTQHRNDLNYYLKVKYVVNSEETIGHKELIVSSFKIHHSLRTASFQLSSPVSLLSEKISNFYYGTFFYQSYIQSAVMVYPTKSDITKAESYNVLSLMYGKGVKYDITHSSYYSLVNLQNIPQTTDGYYDEINIFDDYEIEQDDEETSKIGLQDVSAYSGTRLTIASQLTYQGESEITIPNTFSQLTADNVYVSEFETKKHGTSTIYDVDIDVYNDKFVLKINDTIPNGTKLDVSLAYDNTPITNQYYDNRYPYIATFLEEDYANYNYLSYVNMLDYIRSYYQDNNELISFSCRIDPTLEPLDIICMTIDNITYYLALEEVKVNFNGGFTGSITGRRLQQAISVSIVDYDNRKKTFVAGDTFTYGNAQVVATLYDGSVIDISQSSDLGLNSTSAYRYGDIVGGSGSITQYITGYKYLEIPFIPYQFTIYHEFLAPRITTPNVELSGIYFNLYDDNDSSYDPIYTNYYAPNNRVVVIETSSGTIDVETYTGVGTIHAIEISENEHTDIYDLLEDYIIDYINGELEENVYVYFKFADDPELTTSKVILLEANAQ